MASAIDATKPADAVPASKADLRANLATAKAEITALQTQLGTLSPYVFNGMRNRIINGKMAFDQRNAGAAKTVPAGTYAYGPDRWFGSSNAGGGIFSMQLVSTGGPTGFPSYMRILTTTPKTLVAGDVHIFTQSVEGYHWVDMLYGTTNALPTTLSFWIRGSIAGSYAVAVSNAGGANTYIASYIINVANTWEYKTITVPGPTIGTWATANTAAAGIRFDLGTGTTAQGTTNVWTSTAKISYAGATSLISTNGATLDITGVQWEPGSVATPWDHRLAASIEYMLCQRYYQSGVGRWDGVVNAGVAVSTPVWFTPTMRAAPTLTITSGGADGGFAVGNPVAQAASASVFFLYKIANGTGAGFMSGYYLADAEILL